MNEHKCPYCGKLVKSTSPVKLTGKPEVCHMKCVVEDKKRFPKAGPVR